MAETAKKISMIPAKVQYDRNVKLSEKKMKVAAYCRVSTELEEQDSSYEAQVEYYTSKISENENWKNAGIYADDGKSGTNTKKRADFNAMIQDALAGKIDMILTKSVSRFARNTVPALPLACAATIFCGSLEWLHTHILHPDDTSKRILSSCRVGGLPFEKCALTFSRLRWTLSNGSSPMSCGWCAMPRWLGF